MNPVRLRFSMIPTGSVSLMEARVALTNAKIAQNNQGKFILRIEDASLDPVSPETLKQSLEDLSWLGLQWDEGPFFESQRTSLYQQVLDQLLSEKKTYPCYCTFEKLEEERRRFLAIGKTPRYTGHCRHLSAEQRAEFEAQGIKPAIRLKVERQIIKFHDTLLGDFTVDSEGIGDSVLALSNGRYTNHLMTVVEDENLKISEVIRGENELSHTALQILLYRALGWNPPAYAHLPLILGHDHTLLSKKHSLSQVRDLKTQNYLSVAVAHYLLQMGCHDWEDKRISSLEDWGKRISLERRARTASVFDEEELKRINAYYLRQMSEEEYLQACREKISILSATPSTLLLLREKCRSFQEIETYLNYCASVLPSWGEEGEKMLRLKDAPKVLNLFKQEVGALENLNLEALHQRMESIQQTLKSKSKNIFAPVRVALAGTPHGVDLALVTTLLGKEECFKRIDHALTHLQHTPSN